MIQRFLRPPPLRPQISSVCAAFCLFAPILVAKPTQIDLGPLYDSFPLTLQQGARTEAAGPFFSFQESEEKREWGLHPLFYYGKDDLTDSAEADFLYPFVTYDRFGPEYRVQLLQLFSISGGEDPGEEDRDRITLFPIFFYQQADDPELDYWALFPLYGTIKNRLKKDEIFFVLFPAYSKTTRDQVNTWNVLYPIFHWREGGGVKGTQVWPLFGIENKKVGTRTDNWGDEIVVPGHEKLFVLWPIFVKNKVGMGTENPLSQLLILPFFAHQTSPLRETTTYLWPIGFTKTIDREKQYREWGMPWPLIVFARGEGKNVNRVWPVYSHAETPFRESRFVLWPIYKFDRTTSAPLDRRRTRILFFLYSDLVEKNTERETERRRTTLWPLFHSTKQHNGDEELRLLALFDAFWPENRGIKRNYSPLWSIWRSKKNAETGAKSHSFLWNLYRYDADAESAKGSFLFGLFRYKRTEEGRSWRLFYFPFGDRLDDEEDGVGMGDEVNED